jgi:hypothetical protein
MPPSTDKFEAHPPKSTMLADTVCEGSLGRSKLPIDLQVDRGALLRIVDPQSNRIGLAERTSRMSCVRAASTCRDRRSLLYCKRLVTARCIENDVTRWEQHEIKASWME